jgi:hypothetical protein
LEGLINSELRYIKKVVFWVKPLISLYFNDYLDCSFDFLRFLKVCVFIRYSFNNYRFKFVFEDSNWKIEIEIESIDFLMKTHYINRDVSLIPKKILFNSNYKNIYFISNSNFNRSLWIEKFDHLGIESFPKDSHFLEEDCSEGIKVLEALNFINSTKIIVNSESLDLALDLFDKSEIYKTSPNYLLTWMALSDLKLLSKFSLYLFLSYILDRRTRVYCKNIPINPQLDKILRIFLIPEEKKNFLKINIVWKTI